MTKGFLLILVLAATAALALSGTAAAETGVPCAPTGMETVATDKADYPPGETVHVTGGGYAPACDVEVRIERPDGVVESFVASSDLAGGFALDYLLPGPPGVIGDYRITVHGLGGATLAAMTFADGNGAIDVAPAHYAAPSPSTQQRDFTVLGRVTVAPSDGVKCVRLTVPSGFAIVSGSQTFDVGAGSGWSLALNNISGTPRQLLLSTSSSGATGLPSSGTGNWARFDFKATTPASHTSPAWDLTFADTASCSGANSNPNTVQAGVRIANTNNQTYTADFRDAGGNVVSPSVAPSGPAQTFRLRIANSSGGSGDKIIYAGFALPKCFASPTGVSVATSNGSRPNFTFEVRDGFIRLLGGELEKDQSPDEYVEVTFTSSASGSCSTSTHSFWTSAWKSSTSSATASDNFNLTGNHPAVAVAAANTAPSVAANSATVAVNEGQTALNAGTWSDPDAGQTVTLTASPGTVVKNADGTWSWSYATTDGPAQSGTVTITATDNASTPASSSTTFALTVTNVAPSATFNAPASVNEGSTIGISLSSPSDPSSVDTAAGFDYRFSCDNGTTWTAWGSTTSHGCPTDDNGTRNVKGEIRDKDGGVRSYSASVAVENVAPSATFQAPGSVNEGSNIDVSLAGVVDPGSADTHQYRFKCGDGAWTAYGSSASHTCPTTDDGTVVVQGQVRDDDGGESAEYSASVTVSNVAPSATFGAPGSVSEGSDIDLSLTGVVDPGSADTHEFRFSCDGGSNWTGWSTTASHSCATTDDGTVEVRGQVRDDDGGTSEVYADSVTVDNVAPSATFNAPESVNEGSNIAISLTGVVDPGSADTHEFRFSCDGGSTWTGWSTTASHSCPTNDNGTKSVAGQVRDDDGGTSEVYSDTVTVDNVAPSATFNAPASVNEGSNISVSLTDPSDPSSVDTAAGFQYRFSCDNGTTWTAWSSTTTHACATDDNGTRNVKGEIRDKDGGARTYSASVTVDNVAPSATFNAPTSVNEGSGINLSLTAPSDPSSADTAAGFQYAFDCGDGSGYAAYSSSSTRSCPTTDNGTRSVGGKIKDKDGGVREYTATVTVNNVPPTLTSLTPSSYLVLKGTPVSVTGAYTDPGTGDTFVCTVNWDEPTGTPQNVAGGPSSCSASHTYAAQGTYTVSMSVSDDDGGRSNTLTVIITVYDPGAGGFVTGGGWINSPTGSYAADPTASGRANFGFTSQYKKGASIPTGETEFQLHFASFNFHSDAYEVLVVSGHKAQYRGTGRVNGVPGHKFVLTAYDGQIAGGGGVDRFRIKITRISDDVVVYDTRMGTSEDMDLADPLAISGGSIVIHKAK